MSPNPSAKSHALQDYLHKPETPAPVPSDLTPDQRKIAESCLRKLLSAIQIELPFVFVEKDGKRFYSLSAKRGAVVVHVDIITPIPS